MRVVFLGSDRWSVPSLRAIVDDPTIDVPLVVTREPKPAGRGSALRATAVAEASRALELPLLEVERVRTEIDALHAAEPDALVVVAYGEILRRDVLDIAPAINVHFSLLPRWRGAAPVQWAILEGDPATGVTTMLMDEGLDTGPLLLQQAEQIHTADDAGSLGERLATIGAELLVSTLLGFSDLVPRRQNDDTATPAPKLGAADRVIDWTMSADAIVRRVRAMSPTPGAVTTFRGTGLKVLSARTEPPGVDTVTGGEVPGTVRAWHDTPPEIWVGTGGGQVALVDVVPSGRARMDAGAWIKGIKDPAFHAGERFG